MGWELLLGNLAKAGKLTFSSPSVLLCLFPAFPIFVFTPLSSGGSHSCIFLWVALRALQQNGCHNDSACGAYGEPGRKDESRSEETRHPG